MPRYLLHTIQKSYKNFIVTTCSFLKRKSAYKYLGHILSPTLDGILVSLGNEKVYNITNPFNFMNMISLQGKMNLFEK
jgi:hypothetical protein